jgi:surfactin synthase thioesterase subunit
MRDAAYATAVDETDDATPAKWFVTPRRLAGARASLALFPYAGIGGSLAAGLSRELRLPVAVLGVQLPGRESRISEAPLRRVADIADAATRALAAMGGAPYILMGCSFGALVAYEVALRMTAMGAPPRRLIALACAAPQDERAPTGLAALDDAEFVEAVDRRFASVPEPIKHNAELRRLLLPALRADLEAFDDYRWTPAPPLDAPLLTIAADADRQATPAQLVAWGALTTARAEHCVVAGGHFVLRENPAAVAAVLHEALRRALE